MSTFDLEITFTGLCLYVRDRAKLHVLLPRAECCDVEKHEARIYVNQRWDRWEELGGYALDLTDIGVGTGGTLDLPPTIFDFASLGPGYFVPSRLLIEDDPTLYSRITLMHGERFDTADGARWAMTESVTGCLGTDPVEMSHVLVWRIRGVSNDHLRWTFRLLGSNVLGENPYPRPTEPDKMLKLHIFHAPERNLPGGGGSTPVPTECSSDTHFGAYYALLDSSATKLKPHFRDLGILPEPMELVDGQPVVPGPKGMVFTCMSAQAPVG